jgi:hypothetical protein
MMQAVLHLLHCFLVANDCANRIKFVAEDESDAFIILEFQNMRPASTTSKQIQKNGFTHLEGQQHWGVEVPNQPDVYYHGTTAGNMLDMLVCGCLLSKGDLGYDHPHKPDGVYSYGCKDISDCSLYVDQGCQVLFRSCGINLSQKQSRLLEQTPEGCRLRVGRHQHSRHGSAGFEWIHASTSTEMIRARVSTQGLLAELKLRTPTQSTVGLPNSSFACTIEFVVCFCCY